MENIKEILLCWADQFENDHYTFDIYGNEFIVDLPRETVEAVMDIAILLIDRVVAAKGELHTAEYEAIERDMQEKYPNDWILHTVLHIHGDEHLFARYKDIEPMIAKLYPRGYPMGSAAYLLTVRPGLHELIYAAIRHVDDAEKDYTSLVFTVFLGILAKGWGEGNGWSKENGNWVWRAEDGQKTKAD